MNNLLLIDDDAAHAEQVGTILARCGFAVTRIAEIGESIKILQARTRTWEIVVLVIGDQSRPWFSIIQTLQEAAWDGSMPEVPFFLCVSKRDRGADFQLRIEHMGVRYAFEE